jgi:hypothetical protein
VLDYYLSDPSQTPGEVKQVRGSYSLKSGCILTALTTVPSVTTLFRRSNDTDAYTPGQTRWQASKPKSDKKMYQFDLFVPCEDGDGRWGGKGENGSSDGDPYGNNSNTKPTSSSSSTSSTANTISNNDAVGSSPSLITKVRSQYEHVQKRLIAQSEFEKITTQEYKPDKPNPLNPQYQNALAGAGGMAAVVTTALTVTVLSGGIAAVPVLVTLGMGAIAGGGAVGFTSTKQNQKTIKVTLASTSKRDALKWWQILKKAIEENEGRAKKFSSIAALQQKPSEGQESTNVLLRKLLLPFKTLHYRYNPMNPYYIVDMAAWLDGQVGPRSKWGDSVLVNGMRVLAEQHTEKDMVTYVPYRSVLGGARRAQHPVAATAPDVFLRAMFLGTRSSKTQSKAVGSSCKVRTLGTLGPFADIVHITIPAMAVFWTKPLSLLQIQGHARHFVCVRRWETNDEGAFILTFEPFEDRHDKEWREQRKEELMQERSSATTSQPLYTFDDDDEEDDGDEDDESDLDDDTLSTPWKKRGKGRTKYIVPSEPNAWNGSLHACITVSPVKFGLSKDATPQQKGGGGHGHPSAMAQDCLLKANMLVRPGGYLTFLAVILRFVFGSDLIGAYTQALLVKAMQDIKLSAEHDICEDVGMLHKRLSRSGSSSFLLNESKADLEEKLRLKKIEVKKTEDKIVDAFDPDRRLLFLLQGQLKELAKLQEELKKWGGDGSGADGEYTSAIKPKIWRKSTLEKGAGGGGGGVGGGVIWMLMGFAVVYWMSAYCAEVVVGTYGVGGWLVEWLRVAREEWISGDVLFLMVCCFGGVTQFLAGLKG